MGRWLISGILVLAAMLMACAGPKPGVNTPLTAADVQGMAEVERSEHRSVVWLSDPDQYFDGLNTYLIRAFIPQGAPD